MSTVMDDFDGNASKLAFLRAFGLFDADNQPTRDFFSLLKTANYALGRRRLFSLEGYDPINDVVLKIAEKGQVAYDDWPTDGDYLSWLRRKVLDHIRTKSRGHEVTRKSDEDPHLENTLSSPDTTPRAVAAHQYIEHFVRFLEAQPDADRLRAILPYMPLTKNRPKMAAITGLAEDALDDEVKHFTKARDRFVSQFGAFGHFEE